MYYQELNCDLPVKSYGKNHTQDTPKPKISSKLILNNNMRIHPMSKRETPKV
jgi:hypothetical protein